MHPADAWILWYQSHVWGDNVYTIKGSLYLRHKLGIHVAPGFHHTACSLQYIHPFSSIRMYTRASAHGGPIRNGVHFTTSILQLCGFSILVTKKGVHNHRSLHGSCLLMSMASRHVRQSPSHNTGPSPPFYGAPSIIAVTTSQDVLNE